MRHQLVRGNFVVVDKGSYGLQTSVVMGAC
jgi:hypothetical protein